MTKKSSASASETTAKQPAVRKTSVKRHSKATQPASETLPQAQAPAASLDRHEVARLAYSYWVARNYQPGSPVEDWFRAETELRSSLGA